MTWQPLDCHAHTTMSDGALTVAELVATVRAKGVRPGVSDHLSGDVRYAVKTVDGVREYLDELERHDVARGGEFCWHDALWRELPDELIARFTHLIGSVHAVHLPGLDTPLSMFAPQLPEGMSTGDYLDHHVTNVERMAREMPVDILAHPTLVPFPVRILAPEELWGEEQEDRLVDALAGAGIAFELSSRYQPHERLVRRAHARGVRFSLGSDGHTQDQVGDVWFSLDLARQVGVRDEELYDPVVHGRREQARAKQHGV